MSKADTESIRKRLKRSEIVFNESEHTYKDGDKEYQGITSTLVPFAYPNTYSTPKNMSEEQWKAVLDNAAKKGTAVHNEIQDYCEKGTFPTLPEALNWLTAEEEYKIEWIENEYLVTDGEYFASKIDILALVNGELSIIDIKRTSEIHYDTTALQTSLYKEWFEKMNRGMKIKHTYIFWTRDNNWKLAELDMASKGDIRRLVKAYHEGDKSFVYAPVPSWADTRSLLRLQSLMAKKKVIDAQIEELKLKLEEEVKGHNVTNFVYGSMSVGYIADTESVRFDSARFQQEHPDLYEQYKAVSKRKGYLKITNK